jgi:TRAP-type mannitol/chloroaromatic compound transport system permease small subunit
MTKGMKGLFNRIDAVTSKISKPASLLVFFMMCITTTEVVSRYVFNHPTIWAWPLNRQVFGLFILVAGVYTMSKDQHIRIEIICDLFPSKIRLASRLFALVSLISFLGVLIWQGGWMGLNSLRAAERASGAFNIPLYPFKLLIPLGAFLFLLQGISIFFRKNNE